MAKDIIPEPLKTFNHRPHMARGAVKAQGYGSQSNSYMTYSLSEKASKERLMLIRRDYVNR